MTRHSLLLRTSIVLASALGLVVAGQPVMASAAAPAPGDMTQFAFSDAESVPWALASDGEGILWVTLRGSALLAKSSLDGTISTVLAGSGPSAGPGGVALGSDKRMWIAETAANRIAAVTTSSGGVATYPLPHASSGPASIAAGPDGALWFTEHDGDRIGRITVAGTLTEYDLPVAAGPAGIVTGPDGALWFAMQGSNAIGRITVSGVVSSYPLPFAASEPVGIAVGSDRNLWFTESKGNRIGRISTAGLISEFLLPTAESGPLQIVGGADSALWFTQTAANKVSRITTAGVITEFAVPTPGAAPVGIVSADDGNIWATESAGNRLVRVLTGVLPTSSSAPTVTAPGTKTGQVLTASTGIWTTRPTAYAYQWQRCATADVSSCASISGASSATYTLVTDDAGKRVRVLVTATNLNGSATNPAASSLVSIDGLPPAPVPPAVAGGQSVSIASGVVATLRTPALVRRGALRRYCVVFTNKAVRGVVRMTLTTTSGVPLQTIAVGKAVGVKGKACRPWRIPRTVARGTYLVSAAFTPRADQSATYAAATLSSVLTAR